MFLKTSVTVLHGNQVLANVLQGICSKGSILVSPRLQTNGYAGNSTVCTHHILDTKTKVSLTPIGDAYACMHVNALRSLSQTCSTAYCICCKTPMIQAPYQALQISVSLG